jgi:hypothetical protein
LAFIIPFGAHVGVMMQRQRLLGENNPVSHFIIVNKNVFYNPDGFEHMVNLSRGTGY